MPVSYNIKLLSIVFFNYFWRSVDANDDATDNGPTAGGLLLCVFLSVLTSCKISGETTCWDGS